MKRFLKELSYLSKGERIALYGVVVILLAALAFKIIVSGRPDRLPADTGEIVEKVRTWQLEKEKEAVAQEVKTGPLRKTGRKTELKPFPFDPNTVSSDSLIEMGIPEKIAANIDKYRKAGGTFREPDDIRKIYGLEKSMADSLLPFIIISVNPPEEEPVMENRETVILTELNGAAESGLTALPGIGKTFAKRIIQYRQKLGGFVRPEQLLEVYGMDTNRYNLFKDHITADTAGIRKINLNTATYGNMAGHPYLSSQQANAILSYRKFAGKISRIDELRENHLLPDSTLTKIKDYLTL